MVKLEGNPEHVSTRGRLCAKGNSGMWYSYDPDRILYPLKRVGARGEGKWKRITWDEALTELAAKLDAALKEDPNTIMLKYGRNRTGGTLDRFMKTLGSATVRQPHLGVRVVEEGRHGTDLGAGYRDAGLRQRQVHPELRLQRAGGGLLPQPAVAAGHRRRGRQPDEDRHFRCAPVEYSRLLRRVDSGIPGTDGAVALAMGHVILREDLQDSDFIETWTNVTVEELKEHYKQYTPEWACEDFRRAGRNHRAHRPRVRHHQAGDAYSPIAARPSTSTARTTKRPA